MERYPLFYLFSPCRPSRLRDEAECRHVTGEYIPLRPLSHPGHIERDNRKKREALYTPPSHPPFPGCIFYGSFINTGRVCIEALYTDRETPDGTEDCCLLSLASFLSPEFETRPHSRHRHLHLSFPSLYNPPGDTSNTCNRRARMFCIEEKAPYRLFDHLLFPQSHNREFLHSPGAHL